jgi:hypothetical protein
MKDCPTCAPAFCAIYVEAVPAPVEDPPTRPLTLVPPGAVPEREIDPDAETVCSRCRRHVNECICGAGVSW